MGRSRSRPRAPLSNTASRADGRTVTRRRRLTREERPMVVQAQQQVPGLTRVDLQQHDLSVPGREVIQNRVEIGPEVPAIRHKHPGEEIIYVLEGSLEYDIEGQS